MERINKVVREMTQDNEYIDHLIDGGENTNTIVDILVSIDSILSMDCSLISLDLAGY